MGSKRIHVVDPDCHRIYIPSLPGRVGGISILGKRRNLRGTRDSIVTATNQLLRVSRAGRHTQASTNASGRAMKWWLILFVAFMACRSATASDVLLLTRTGQHSAYQDQLSLAARFYGLDIRNVSIDEASESSKIARMLKTSDISAAVLSTGALEFLDPTATFNSLKRADGSRIP